MSLFFWQRTDAPRTDPQKLAAANNAFAFKLLKQIAGDSPVQNVFISPYSASAALQMVANGAAGQTKTEMQEVMETDPDNTGLSEEDLNRVAKEIGESLYNNNGSVILEIANAIWVRNSASIIPDFIACNQEFFGATVAPLDFANPPRCEDIINQWASKKTHGRINQIANGMIDPVWTRLFLANAVYFKGKWSDPFKPGATRDRPFYLRDGRQKVIPLMSKSKKFTYRRGRDYQAVRLPYQGKNLAMYVFLPDPNSSPEKLLTMMTGDAWRRTIKPGFNDMDGDLMLPKFRLEYSVNLPQPLQKLGMKTAFYPEKADFSRISQEPLYISAALQKTFVEVNEEGTEAAAVTGFAVAAFCVVKKPPKRFTMIVDRPFLFLIEDNQTGTILFMGLIYNPPKS